jgi:hypothetical protein
VVTLVVYLEQSGVFGFGFGAEAVPPKAIVVAEVQGNCSFRFTEAARRLTSKVALENLTETLQAALEVLGANQPDRQAQALVAELAG